LATSASGQLVGWRSLVVEPGGPPGAPGSCANQLGCWLMTILTMRRHRRQRPCWL